MSTPERPHPAPPDDLAEHKASLSALWKQAREPRGPSPAAEAAIRSLAASVRPQRSGAPKLALAIAASLLLGIGLSLRLLPPASPPAPDAPSPGAAPPSPLDQTDAPTTVASPMRRADALPPPLAASQGQRVHGDIAAKAERDATPGIAAVSPAAAAPTQSRTTAAAAREQAAFTATEQRTSPPDWTVKLISLLRQHAQPDALPDALRAIGWRVDCVASSPNRPPCHAESLDPSARDAPRLSWDDANHITLDSITPADQESLVHLLERDLATRNDDLAACTLHLQLTDRPQRLQLLRGCVDHAAHR